MNQVMIPQLNKQEALNFSKQWTHNGLAIVIDDVYIQFATDFANIVLKNFVLQCAAQAEAAMRAQQPVEGQATFVDDVPAPVDSVTAAHGHSELVVQ